LREGGGGEGIITQHCVDPFDYTIDIFEYVAIPETQHVKILAGQPLRSPLVVLNLIEVGVRCAVYFNDQASRQANEIAKVWAQRVLTAEP
jgi:hypothetical protein